MVFVQYLRLCWHLLDVYRLEPAGSHSVWGPDDSHFPGYTLGSAQLRGQPTYGGNAVQLTSCHSPHSALAKGPVADLLLTHTGHERPVRCPSRSSNHNDNPKPMRRRSVQFDITDAGNLSHDPSTVSASRVFVTSQQTVASTVQRHHVRFLPYHTIRTHPILVLRDHATLLFVVVISIPLVVPVVATACINSATDVQRRVPNAYRTRRHMSLCPRMPQSLLAVSTSSNAASCSFTLSATSNSVSHSFAHTDNCARYTLPVPPPTHIHL
jgi:Phosphotyrosyl phosphate activator (PTPA) protein